MNLSKLLERFPDEVACLEEILRLRNLSCCGKKLYPVKGRKAFICSCGKQIYPLKGTIFENTKTPLRYWFYAMFVMTNTRSGVSAKTLQRELGVTYKTAWRMCHKIRTLMDEKPTTQLTGTVEIDETYVGGKRRGNQWYPDKPPKDVLFGAVQRKGKVRVRHVPNNGKWTLLDQIEANIDPKAQIYSDEFASYWGLKKHGYKHGSVTHSRYEWTDGDIHTQNIENVWSHLKRGIKGVYRGVSSKYLQSYANEFAFRYNHRNSKRYVWYVII